MSEKADRNLKLLDVESLSSTLDLEIRLRKALSENRKREKSERYLKEKLEEIS
jgi:hypothetical protein